jgi:hypothetical protein
MKWLVVFVVDEDVLSRSGGCVVGISKVEAGKRTSRKKNEEEDRKMK